MIKRNEIDITEQKKEKEHTTEIFEYIRRNQDGKKVKVGVILGTVDGDAIKIGWSKCNRKLGDKFDSELGLQYAMVRAMDKSETINPPAPPCIHRQLRKFGARCIRYFKNAHKMEIPA